MHRERRLRRTMLRGVENPRGLKRIFRVLHGLNGDVLNLARARSRRAKFSTHAFMDTRFAKFNKFGAKFSTDGSIQVDLSAPQVSPCRPACLQFSSLRLRSFALRRCWVYCELCVGLRRCLIAVCALCVLRWDSNPGPWVHDLAPYLPRIRSGI